MKGYLKSLNYWCYNMERVFLIMMGTMIILCLFQIGEMEQLFYWILSVLPMLGAVSFISLGHNIAFYQVPQALSCGSTRKENFFGVAVMMHIIMLQFLLLTVLSYIFIPNEYSYNYIKMCGLLLLIFCGAGNGLGAGVLRFGGKAVRAVYLIMIFLASGSIGMIMSLDMDLNTITSFFYSSTMFGIVILFDLLMLGAYWLGLKNYEVKG